MPRVSLRTQKTSLNLMEGDRSVFIPKRFGLRAAVLAVSVALVGFDAAGSEPEVNDLLVSPVREVMPASGIGCCRWNRS